MKMGPRLWKAGREDIEGSENEKGNQKKIKRRANAGADGGCITAGS